MRLTELVAPALAGGHAADMVLNTAARIRAPFAVADAGERQASVAAAMRGLLDTAMRDDDRRYLLDMCLWRYTEFDKNRHKFATRYRTATVLGPVPVEVNHEHVVERRWLLDRITSHPDKLDGYLQLAVACIVSRDEHIRLTGGVGFGWERYALAGVEVVDTVTMRPLDLDAAVTEQRRVLEMLDEQIPASPAAAVPPPPRPAPAVATATSQPPVLDGDVVAAPSVAEDDTDIAAVRALSGRSGRRRGVHLAVDAALRAAGYRRTLPGGTGGATYVSYVDPASGRNFVNLTATVAHLMRQDLRPALAGVPGVRLTGRYPQVHLDAPDAVETLQLLAVRFKR